MIFLVEGGGDWQAGWLAAATDATTRAHQKQKQNVPVVKNALASARRSRFGVRILYLSA